MRTETETNVSTNGKLAMIYGMNRRRILKAMRQNLAPAYPRVEPGYQPPVLKIVAADGREILSIERNDD